MTRKSSWQVPFTPRAHALSRAIRESFAPRRAALWTGGLLAAGLSVAAPAQTLELSDLNGSNGFVINGIDTFDNAGHSVSGAGDVNGDGFDDVIIGAIGADPNGNNFAGESYVVFSIGGGFPASLELSSLNGSNGFVLNGVDVNDFSGWSVSGAGDVNGDGFDDLIIGTRTFGGPDVGESYVVFGTDDSFPASLEVSSLNGSNGFVINSVDPANLSSVSGAGDVNGDGFDDVIIGARSAGSNGASYVVFGTSGGFGASLELSSLNGSNGFILNGVDFGDASGDSVSGAGDVNGDGFDDLIIGATGADPNGNTDAGESYVVFGAASGFPASLELSSLNGSNGFVINGVDPGDVSGNSVSGAGDVNGDGFDDLIIGALGADPNGNNFAGESYVVFSIGGGFPASLELSSLNGSNGFVFNGVDPDDSSGESVSGAGDVNGDGFDDLIIGASFADPNGNSRAGESYVVFGASGGFAASLTLSNLDGSNGFVINGIDPGDLISRSFSGTGVSGAGDINGDGLDDLIIGAVGADPNGNSNAGESYVIFGESTNSPPTAEAGPNQSIHAGQTVLLDGSGSTDLETDAADLDYAWSFLSLPAGSTAAFDDPTSSMPNFTADQIGSYEIQLTVTDEGGLISMDQVMVSSLNVPPQADAGADIVTFVGSSVILDGSGSSDADGDPLNFAWTLIAQPSGSLATLSGATSVMPMLTPDQIGAYQIELIVNDGFDDSIPGSVTVTAIDELDYAQLVLMEISDIVSDLPSDSFDRPSSRHKILNGISRALNRIQHDRIRLALFVVERLIKRTDGCALRGSPDPISLFKRKDWIVNCDDQLAVYDRLIEVRDLLTP